MSQGATRASARRQRRTRRLAAAATPPTGSQLLLKVTLRRSLIGHPKDQRQTARALGLTRMNSSVVRPDNPAIRGMVTKIGHLVRVEQVEPEKKA